MALGGMAMTAPYNTGKVKIGELYSSPPKNYSTDYELQTALLKEETASRRQYRAAFFWVTFIMMFAGFNLMVAFL